VQRGKPDQSRPHGVIHPFVALAAARDEKRDTKRGDKSAKEIETAKELRALATGSTVLVFPPYLPCVSCCVSCVSCDD
jgi:hypothetical protein